MEDQLKLLTRRPQEVKNIKVKSPRFHSREGPSLRVLFFFVSFFFFFVFLLPLLSTFLFQLFVYGLCHLLILRVTRYTGFAFLVLVNFRYFGWFLSF